MTAQSVDAVAQALRRRGLLRPPRCSFAHGAAGVAYFLLRCSAVAGDAETLEGASHWVGLAEQGIEGDDAFAGPGRVFPDPLRAPPSSLHFGEAGVWCVGAMVAGHRDERDGVERCVRRFAAIADECPADALDAVTGAAGLLLGTAVLLEQLGGRSRGRLTAVGETLAARLMDATLRHPGFEPGAWLGAAHGWCGIAHALLRWCEATGSEPSPPLRDLLDRLAEARMPSGLWPRREGAEDVWPGWCHGSAGWVQLWTLAWEVLGDRDLLRLCGPPAAHAVQAEQGEGASLCCGKAGEAYAAVAVYQASGLDGWLGHADRLMTEAGQEPVGEDFPEQSLWGGDLGVALLHAELAAPDRAAMPLYRAH